jgi:hypothetical protein
LVKLVVLVTPAVVLLPEMMLSVTVRMPSLKRKASLTVSLFL